MQIRPKHMLVMIIKQIINAIINVVSKCIVLSNVEQSIVEFVGTEFVVVFKTMGIGRKCSQVEIN